MGMFDWLNEPMGGYAEGPTQSGAAGVPRSNITWGQLLGAVMKSGGGRGGNMLGGFAQNAFQMPTDQQRAQQQFPNATQQGSVSVFDQPYSSIGQSGNHLLASTAGQDSGQGNTSVQDIMQIAAMFA